MNKGRWIYLGVALVNLMMMLMPTSTSLFSLVVQDLKSTSWLRWLPDIFAVCSIVMGYLGLKIFYKKRSRYIRHYPYLILVLALIWTGLIQLK